MDGKNGILELSAEQMGRVSGGDMTTSAAVVFDALIGSLKKNDRTLDSAVDFVQNSLSFDNPLLAGVTPAEAVAYIRTRWDQILVE